MRTAISFIALLTACSDPAELTVFAASSIAPALEEAREHDGMRVRVVTAGSQILRRQIEAGAPADVFIPASEDHLRDLAIDAQDELICNQLVIATRRDDVRSVRDLANVERLVVGTPEVPIGAYTEAMFARAGDRWGPELRQRIEARVVSRELDVRQVLAKVVLGEADAAIVYASDMERADGLHGVPIDDGLADRPRYPIVVLEGSAHLELAHGFSAWMRSPGGIAILERHGLVRCE